MSPDPYNIHSEVDTMKNGNKMYRKAVLIYHGFHKTMDVDCGSFDRPPLDIRIRLVPPVKYGLAQAKAQDEYFHSKELVFTLRDIDPYTGDLYYECEDI